jgi:GTP1/Obg family GTP-binding protein
MNGIDDLKDAIAKINNSLTKIETILEMYIKKMDRE